METKDPKTISQALREAGMNPAAKEDIDYSDLAAVAANLANEFPDIVPTPKELYLGQLQAYSIAAERIQKEKLQAERKARREQFTRMWTYDEMRVKAIEMGHLIAASENFKNGFVIDKHNEFVFHLLCLYFTNDPEFENHGIGGVNYSLKKGIWLQSGVRGSGKSTLLRCFQVNKRCLFGYQHTTELGNKYQRGGYAAIDFFMGLIPQPAGASNFYQNHAGWMYDELFGDTKVNHMGTPLMVSEYIINKLYDFSNNHKGNFWKFHCTSNAAGEDIKAISGENYRSRMPDMFNLIKLDGPNRRLA